MASLVIVNALSEHFGLELSFLSGVQKSAKGKVHRRGQSMTLKKSENRIITYFIDRW